VSLKRGLSVVDREYMSPHTTHGVPHPLQQSLLPMSINLAGPSRQPSGCRYLNALVSIDPPNARLNLTPTNPARAGSEGPINFLRSLIPLFPRRSSLIVILTRCLRLPREFESEVGLLFLFHPRDEILSLQVVLRNI